MVRVGVIGLGFMGRTHLGAYARAARDGHECRIVALCDRRVEAAQVGSASPGHPELVVEGERDGLASGDLEDARFYRDAEALLADDEVDLVSVCTHTDTHADLTIRALRAGRHVLVEKPVALRAADVAPVVEAARKAGTFCMPAFCMRFWPGWSWLKDRIEDGSLGSVRSACFRRLGARPDWGQEFYGRDDRTGGALVDLHIHDADFVRWCFGEPDEVVCAGSTEHLTAFYRYAGGPDHVVAEGSWGHQPGFGFRMGYVVRFDEATAEFDLTRSPVLTVVRGDRVEPVALPSGTGYDGEVRHMIESIVSNRPPRVATMDDALATARLLDAESRSLTDHCAAHPDGFGGD